MSINQIQNNAGKILSMFVKIEIIQADVLIVRFYVVDF